MAQALARVVFLDKELECPIEVFHRVGKSFAISADNRRRAVRLSQDRSRGARG